jgi:6-phosphogluconolactonase (cycloisomerase 2 family)
LSRIWARTLTFWLALLLLTLAPGAGLAQEPDRRAESDVTQDEQLDRRGNRFREPAGAVYVMTNATTGNEVLVFLRDVNGYLTYPLAWPTGGQGTGGSLGNQGGLVLTRNHGWLLAVNAGSDSITVFEVQPFGLRFIETRPSGGTRPVSIAEHDSELVYVLNQGSDSISGFKLGADGKLTPLPVPAKPLSGANTNPAQIKFDAHGDLLLVTEKNTNLITVFDVDADGYATFRKSVVSAGQTPFGFVSGFRDQIFVSEATGGAADAGALTSYELRDDAELRVVSRSVGADQTATCWVALTPDGRHAFVTNTGSDTISSYRVNFHGGLELLEPIAAHTGDGPIDLTFSSDGRYLYVLNRAGGSIGAYRLNPNGRLIPIHGGVDGLPTSINGVVTR